VHVRRSRKPGRMEGLKIWYGRLVRRVVDIDVCYRCKEYDVETVQVMALGRDLLRTKEAFRTGEADLQRGVKTCSESPA